MFRLSSVPERRWNVHADLQPHSHDASHWTLERMPPVPRSDAPRLSAEYLGLNQRASGIHIRLMKSTEAVPVIQEEEIERETIQP